MKIVNFLSNNEPNPDGYLYSQLLQLTDQQMEYSHDVIQWLFPTKTVSTHNLEAPILTDEDIEEIKGNDTALNMISSGYKRMLSFYGLDVEVQNKNTSCASHQTKMKIVPTDDFFVNSLRWLKYNNHNHLRLTRIMECLRLIGRWQDAMYLGYFLLNLAEMFPNQISKETKNYWSQEFQRSANESWEYRHELV